MKKSYRVGSEPGQGKQAPLAWAHRVAAAREPAGPATAVAEPTSRIAPSQAEIAERAKAIWQAKGRPRGQDEQNWLEAEAQLKREYGSA